MSADPVMTRFAFAKTVTAEAGRLADDYFRRLGTLTIKSKGVQDLVSEADVETEKLIRARVAEAFSEDGFFGEETGFAAEGRRGVWVVDPIDGTQPFLTGLPNWCVSVAFVHDGVLQFGCVYSPPLDEFFAGGRGSPATLNEAPIRVHAGTSLEDGVTSVGYNRRIAPARIAGVIERLVARGGMFYRNGSGALALCYVACGRLIGYVEPYINAWDCLGAIAVIEAAGGTVNDFLGAPDALRKGNQIVAGPPAVYPALCEVLG